MGCDHLKESQNARVLVGGLGMGFTLKAVLDTLPTTAETIVAELNPSLIGWCREPLAILTNHAVDVVVDEDAQVVYADSQVVEYEEAYYIPEYL